MIAAEGLEGAGATRTPAGWAGWLTRALGFALSVYALYWVLAIVPAQVYRPTFLLLALAAAFLMYPARAASRRRPTAVDWLLVVLSATALIWPVLQGQAFELRAATPSGTDVVLGLILVLVVLEATRRTTGLMLPGTAAVFLVYAWGGPLLDRVGLSLIAHRGYSLERIVGTLYVTLEGVLGVPLDVAATYIVLFTVYGAVVERGGHDRHHRDVEVGHLEELGHQERRGGHHRAASLGAHPALRISGHATAPSEGVRHAAPR